LSSSRARARASQWSLLIACARVLAATWLTFELEETRRGHSFTCERAFCPSFHHYHHHWETLGGDEVRNAFHVLDFPDEKRKKGETSTHRSFQAPLDTQRVVWKHRYLLRSPWTTWPTEIPMENSSYHPRHTKMYLLNSSFVAHSFHGCLVFLLSSFTLEILPLSLVCFVNR